jgi:protein-tyrosine phosphatase
MYKEIKHRETPCRIVLSAQQAIPFKLLFLCTGNYYRSRFAEILFNTLAGESGLNWTADSRGVAVHRSLNNVGPISIHVVKGLEAKGITMNGQVRFPLQLQEQDLQVADLVIALKEAEHRLLLEKRFPLWSDKVEYWHVHDLGMASANEALGEIERQVNRLILRLS